VIPAQDDFIELCRRGQAQANRHGRHILISWTAPLRSPPRRLYDRLIASVASSDHGFVWNSSWSGRSLLAMGSALDLGGRGDARMGEIADAWRDQMQSTIIGGLRTAGGGPVLMGGFAFRAAASHPGGFPDGLMWVPAVQFDWTNPHRPVVTLNVRTAPAGAPEEMARRVLHHALRLLTRPVPAARLALNVGPTVAVQEVPPAARWRQLVDEAQSEITAGAFTKVVLARQMILRTDEVVRPAASLRFLLDRQVTGAVFGVGLSGHWFLGSTPECLVRIDGTLVNTHGLAGSAARGSDRHHDDLLEHRLRTDPKIGKEHAVAADFIAHALREFCLDIEIDTAEPVLKLADIQHLQTHIRGVLPDGHGIDLLSLVRSLHPTPAVGGFPRLPALRWLARNEPIDRGWYAGPVGWMGPDDTGEMAVALRSAHLDGDTATIYAGCGIVAGSDDHDEYLESVLKMRPMLASLGLRRNDTPTVVPT
jgi:salicylate biosynthesis isochorismate synthase